MSSPPRVRPDELAAAARRWYVRHHGPETEASLAVAAALERSYADVDALRQARAAWARRLASRRRAL